MAESSALSESFPSALEDSIVKLKLDKEKFLQVHGIIHTGTDDSAEAAAAALVLLIKDNAGVVLDVVTKSFPEKAWNMTSVLKLLLHLLKNRLSTYVKLEPYFEQLIPILHQSHQSYQDFRKVFNDSNIQPAKMEPAVPGVREDNNDDPRFVKLTWMLASYHRRQYKTEVSDANKFSASVAVATMTKLSDQPIAELFEMPSINSEADKIIQKLGELDLVYSSDIIWNLPTLVPKLYESLSSPDSHQFLDDATLPDYFDYLVGPEPSDLTVPTPPAKKPRTVTPPIYSSLLELNEWAISVSFMEVVKPPRKLKVRASQLSNILNPALAKLCNLGFDKSTTRQAPVRVRCVPPEVGLVNIQGDLTPDKQLARVVVAVYYHALEAILFWESSNAKNSEEMNRDEAFHRGVLAVSLLCVLKALGSSQKLQVSNRIQNLRIYNVFDITQATAYDFLRVCGPFVKALTTDTARGKITSPLIFDLPKALQDDLSVVEVNVLDSLLWGRELNSPFVRVISTLKANKEWPPPELCLDDSPVEYGECSVEFNSVSYIFRKILKLVYSRIQELCNDLELAKFVRPVYDTVRFIFANHVDICWNRHVDHWMLCALYGVSRTVKKDIKFATIVDSYVVIRRSELGAVTCQRVVRQIQMEGPESFGNIIQLYNQVFVPATKTFLLNNKDLQEYNGVAVAKEDSI